MKPHFMPVGKPAPPRPRRPESFISWISSSGCAPNALRRAVYPSSRSYTRSFQASGDSHRLVTTGVSLASAAWEGLVTSGLLTGRRGVTGGFAVAGGLRGGTGDAVARAGAPVVAPDDRGVGVETGYR